MIYRIEWTEDIICWNFVEADSEAEAMEKFYNHEEIPDSIDTEPGKGKRRKIKISESTIENVRRRRC